MENENYEEDGASVRFQLTGPLFEFVEDWRRAQGKIPTRTDAVRHFLEQARNAEKDARAEA